MESASSFFGTAFDKLPGTDGFKAPLGSGRISNHYNPKDKSQPQTLEACFFVLLSSWILATVSLNSGQAGKQLMPVQ